MAQQGEDSSVEKQRYYSLTLLPPKGVRCTFCEVKASQNFHKISHGLSSFGHFWIGSGLTVQFHPPSRKDSRMAFLSDTGPLRLIAGSLTFRQNGALT